MTSYTPVRMQKIPWCSSLGGMSVIDRHLASCSIRNPHAASVPQTTSVWMSTWRDQTKTDSCCLQRNWCHYVRLSSGTNWSGKASVTFGAFDVRSMVTSNHLYFCSALIQYRSFESNLTLLNRRIGVNVARLIKFCCKATLEKTIVQLFSSIQWNFDSVIC